MCHVNATRAYAEHLGEPSILVSKKNVLRFSCRCDWMSCQTCTYYRNLMYWRSFTLRPPKHYTPSNRIGCWMAPIGSTCYIAHHFLASSQVLKTLNLRIWHIFLTSTSYTLPALSTPPIEFPTPPIRSTLHLLLSIRPYAIPSPCDILILQPLPQFFRGFSAFISSSMCLLSFTGASTSTLSSRRSLTNSSSIS